jgi:hypothetical protein
VLGPTIVKNAAINLGIKEYNPDGYEGPNYSANISIDDVCVKAQKPNRPMPDGQEKKKALTILSPILRTARGNMSSTVTEFPMSFA